MAITLVKALTGHMFPADMKAIDKLNEIKQLTAQDKIDLAGHYNAAKPRVFEEDVVISA